MAPVIKELERRKVEYFILHTGQHYSYYLDRVFFEQLDLPEPKYNLDSGSGSHAEETGRMLIGIEKVLKKERPDNILVEGDTNSVFAGALAAVKIKIRVGHVEAGLRSYDHNMPEEINRILVDHISDYLFAPTQKAKEILLGEGISETKIFITGNTIVDAVYENVNIAQKTQDTLQTLDLKPGGYFLLTLHRQENVDSQARFASILKGIENVSNIFNVPIVYPVHPRSRKMIAEFQLQSNRLVVIDPVAYLSFLQLESNAKLVFTDSGGVQEETCILHVPCVTLRDNTERPETVEVGANIVAGTSPDKILECSRVMLGRENNWTNPFGDGKAAEKIVKMLTV